VAYQIDLPKELKIHDVFHVSLLHPYKSVGTIQPPPAIFIDAEEEFEVHILDHRDRPVRTKGHKHEFLVRWHLGA